VPEIQLSSEITVRMIQNMGGDHMVVAAAKVSTSGESAMAFADPSSVEGTAGLIGYLMKHRHGTPFEHSSLTFFVHAPIFVWREWHRHRIGFSYNEESARYKPLDPVFWVPRRNRPMVPVPGWKPGRPKFWTLTQAAEFALDSGATDEALNQWAEALYDREIARKRTAYETAYRAYTESIADGIALEVARSVLPVGIYSSCWVTCNPRSLMAFLSLRIHDPSATVPSYPQAEIQEAAQLAESFLSQGWPLTHAAFHSNGRVGP
jgi:thymidylate synthase (FAD)